MPEFTFMPDPRTIGYDQFLAQLSRGVHNSFLQATLRMGLLGGALLSLAFLAAFPRAALPGALRNHAALMFWLIFVTSFVNPPLESPIQLVGVGLIYGYLIALRRVTEREQHLVHLQALPFVTRTAGAPGVRAGMRIERL